MYIVDRAFNVAIEDVTDHIKSQGLNVIETIPNPGDNDQVFIVTKDGRPPCALEKRQITEPVLSNLDAAVANHSCHYLPKRLMLIKRDLKPSISIVS